jgi:hypothetical protein
LLQLLLWLFFERRQKLSRFLRVGRQHAVEHNGITIGDACHRPKAFVGKEGVVAKLIKELLLQALKFLRFNRPTVVVGIKACGANRLDRKRGDEAAAPRGTLVAMLCESSSSYSPSSYSTSLMSGDKAGQRFDPWRREPSRRSDRVGLRAEGRGSVPRSSAHHPGG